MRTASQRATSRAYYLKHCETIKAAAQRYRAENPDKVRATNLDWQTRHIEHRRTQGQAYYQRNKARHATRAAAYRVKNREGLLAKKKEYYNRLKRENPDKLSTWRNRNKEKARVYAKNHRRNNPGLQTIYAARKRANRVTTTAEANRIELFVGSVRSNRKQQCYYCPTVMDGRKMHIDHVSPLCAGGKHEVGNLCASCPPCNLNKRTRPIGKWQPKSSQQVLPL